jgi:hypothetical protein
VSQSLNFFLATSVMAVIIFVRGSQSYPGVTPISQGGFGATEFMLSASVH